MTYPYTSERERAALFKELTKDCPKQAGAITMHEKTVFSLSCKYSPFFIDDTGKIGYREKAVTCKSAERELVPCNCFIGADYECLDYEPKEEEKEMTTKSEKKVKAKSEILATEVKKEVEATPKKTRNSVVKQKIIDMIEVGKYTRLQIIEELVKQDLGVKPITIRTMLSDGKNPRYTPFKKLIIENNVSGVLSFRQVVQG